MLNQKLVCYIYKRIVQSTCKMVATSQSKVLNTVKMSPSFIEGDGRTLLFRERTSKSELSHIFDLAGEVTSSQLSRVDINTHQ